MLTGLREEVLTFKGEFSESFRREIKSIEKLMIMWAVQIFISENIEVLRFAP